MPYRLSSTGTNQMRQVCVAAAFNPPNLSKSTFTFSSEGDGSKKYA